MSTKINGRIKENSIRRLVRIVNSVRNKFESSFEILKYFSTILTVRLTTYEIKKFAKGKESFISPKEIIIETIRFCDTFRGSVSRGARDTIEITS